MTLSFELPLLSPTLKTDEGLLIFHLATGFLHLSFYDY